MYFFAELPRRVCFSPPAPYRRLVCGEYYVGPALLLRAFRIVWQGRIGLEVICSNLLHAQTGSCYCYAMPKAAHNDSINVDSRIADLSKVQAELSEYQWYVLEVVRGAQYDPTIAILRSMIAFAGVLILGAATASIWTPIFRV
jgi:hypothetical protein